MGKKYLDTKQSTIEAAVLDVWVDAAEEQKAIRSAARMIVGDTIDEAPATGPIGRKRSDPSKGDDTGRGHSAGEAQAAVAAAKKKAEDEKKADIVRAKKLARKTLNTLRSK